MKAVVAATAGFVVLSLVVTWPLAIRLTTSIPGDHGDPLFVIWVMGWVARQFSTALTDPAALRSFWDAGIFYPEPGALALSEHFITQTMLVWPLYGVTHNPILCYNVAFLGAFVLTGLGTMLFVRGVSGSLLAGALSGVVASFNEYRLVWEVSHLQVLSIWPLPFVFLGIHRYIATGRRRALIGAAAAWIALNCSSVYLLAYCAPFIAAFTLAEMWRLARWRDHRAWRDLIAATAAVSAVTLPFLAPYAAVQQRLAVYRPLPEVMAYSATLDAYWLAIPKLIVPCVLAAVPLIMALMSVSTTRSASRSASALRIPALAAIFLMFLGCSMWLSLGPVVQSGGIFTATRTSLDVPSAYAALARLPGYSGLRVPARFIALFWVFLGVAAGLGASELIRAARRSGAIVVLVAMSVVVWQAGLARVKLDQPIGSAATSPAYLIPAPRLPPVYRAVDRLPEGSVLAEFPFGDPSYELRYMLFAAIHGRTLMNGYSGVYPPRYLSRREALQQPLRDPHAAWSALVGATHVVVHEAAWLDTTGAQIGAWLQERGSRLIGEVDRAALYELPGRTPFD